ncbi:MAG: hypothetical protein AAFR55_08810 [Pseudomonadota bacterium]
MTRRNGWARSVRYALGLAVPLAFLGLGGPGIAQTNAPPAPEDRAVTVTNLSEPVRCAEKDNVAIAFASARVTSFEIEAAHPAYINAIGADSFAADWTDCSFTEDPVFKSNVTKPTRQTLYETPDLWVVGWTFPTFWRPATTPFVIGGKSFEGLHLIQVWMIRPMGGEEVLVVYPQDGYWRIRPKAPKNRDLTAFGSSVLIGPVTDAGRPVVELSRLTFAPEKRRFTLAFKRGGTATVQMATVNALFHVLKVRMSAAIEGAPFAMLRSMYVTRFNNDAERVAGLMQSAGDATAQWREDDVLAFKGGAAKSLWLGRTVISRHNTSSPDHVLRRFREGPPFRTEAHRF